MFAARLPTSGLVGVIVFVAFIATVPASNWMIANLGVTCVPDGPCLIPVWPGVLAPSGVLMAGIALVLRDLVQEALGIAWAVAPIVIGGCIAALVTSPALAGASVAAFLIAETADLSVFTALRRRGLIVASVASSMIGLVLDSVIFVEIAFGDLVFITGQIIGKAWMILAAIPFLLAIQRRRKASAP